MADPFWAARAAQDGIRPSPSEVLGSVGGHTIIGGAPDFHLMPEKREGKKTPKINIFDKLMTSKPASKIR